MVGPLLFDIDGTLVDTKSPVHGNAILHACDKKFGTRSSFAHFDPQGLIDWQVLAMLAIRFGILPDEAGLDSAISSATRHFAENITPADYVVIEGVLNALRLLQEEDFQLAILSGNIGEIAWMKLELCSLRRYFPFGAFGDEATTRPELVQVARRKWVNELKRSPESFNPVIIGDTPLDVAAAKANNIPCVAVGTGASTQFALKAAGADLVLGSLEEEGALLDYLKSLDET